MLDQTDSQNISAIRTEAEAMRILRAAGRDPVAVYSRHTSGGSNTLRISIRQRSFGEARLAIAALFGGIARLKHIFVFDEDIDIRNDLQVEWALGTRFQADQDLVILHGIPGMSMDPSLQGRRTGAKTGFDCTKPFGRDGEIPLTRSAAKVFKGPARFQTIEQALATAPMFYADLVESIGSERRPRDRLRAGRAAAERTARPRSRRPLSSGSVKARRHRHRRRPLPRSQFRSVSFDVETIRGVSLMNTARAVLCGALHDALACCLFQPLKRRTRSLPARSVARRRSGRSTLPCTRDSSPREDLDLELNFAQSGAAVTQQLTGGSLDVALSVGITDPIRAIEKGAPLALVRVIGNAAPYVLIGKPGLKSITDLKGKIISVGADNDITTVYFERMMAANGLQEGRLRHHSGGRRGRALCRAQGRRRRCRDRASAAQLPGRRPRASSRSA